MPNLKQNADGSMGLQGKDLGDGEFVNVDLKYVAGGVTSFSSSVFSRAMQVKAITGCPDTITTNAVTATIYQAPSGTAIGSGTALHSGTYSGQGTAATNQSLTVTNGAIPAGSRIGLVWSGSPGAAGAGVVTVTLAPL